MVGGPNEYSNLQNVANTIPDHQCTDSEGIVNAIQSGQQRNGASRCLNGSTLLGRCDSVDPNLALLQNELLKGDFSYFWPQNNGRVREKLVVFSNGRLLDTFSIRSFTALGAIRWRNLMRSWHHSQQANRPTATLPVNGRPTCRMWSNCLSCLPSMALYRFA